MIKNEFEPVIFMENGEPLPRPMSDVNLERVIIKALDGDTGSAKSLMNDFVKCADNQLPVPDQLHLYVVNAIRAYLYEDVKLERAFNVVGKSSQQLKTKEAVKVYDLVRQKQAEWLEKYDQKLPLELKGAKSQYAAFELVADELNITSSTVKKLFNRANKDARKIDAIIKAQEK